ncbi:MULTISPECIES: DUF6787 family protein [Flavobacteriaceae]|uniref:Diacylglyceryl transferase n=2 Tax=Flavobacteriaceae TaxID=49546 RepID=A0A4Y8AW18_9FLAO|nr:MULTISPECIES: DUF6787 family protein [Flavobacteriaceae]TEW76679.1 diacylglyceryl transferase [Gramella jeungdoensis]GGK50927.1 hypothetical protein GCM10007963_19140 [Lutibacter litoralis]
MEKLKKRWGLKSNFQIVLILIVFAINGSFAAYIAKPLTEFIGLEKATTNPWIFWPIRILLIFIIYQITLPLVGFCFGQFKFFWNLFTKKMLMRMGFKSFFKEI